MCVLMDCEGNPDRDNQQHFHSTGISTDIHFSRFTSKQLPIINIRYSGFQRRSLRRYNFSAGRYPEE